MGLQGARSHWIGAYSGPFSLHLLPGWQPVLQLAELLVAVPQWQHGRHHSGLFQVLSIDLSCPLVGWLIGVCHAWVVFGFLDSLVAAKSSGFSLKVIILSQSLASLHNHSLKTTALKLLGLFRVTVIQLVFSLYTSCITHKFLVSQSWGILGPYVLS